MLLDTINEKKNIFTSELGKFRKQHKAKNFLITNNNKENLTESIKTKLIFKELIGSDIYYHLKLVFYLVYKFHHQILPSNKFQILAITNLQ